MASTTNMHFIHETGQPKPKRKRNDKAEEPQQQVDAQAQPPQKKLNPSSTGNASSGASLVNASTPANSPAIKTEEEQREQKPLAAAQFSEWTDHITAVERGRRQASPVDLQTAGPQASRPRSRSPEKRIDFIDCQDGRMTKRARLSCRTVLEYLYQCRWIYGQNDEMKWKEDDLRDILLYMAEEIASQSIAYKNIDIDHLRRRLRAVIEGSRLQTCVDPSHLFGGPHQPTPFQFGKNVTYPCLILGCNKDCATNSDRLDHMLRDHPHPSSPDFLDHFLALVLGLEPKRDSGAQSFSPMPYEYLLDDEDQSDLKSYKRKLLEFVKRDERTAHAIYFGLWPEVLKRPMVDDPLFVLVDAALSRWGLS
ncbi:hypothetical protein BXZ70DRAFT_358173 [Cristinia sonorae]|uniref:Uncharacterized protein n=1 Tax=Cristinia sonorae TaxID=1940300 RepID=A0A8K0UJ63_9AGAR|nr:hypothetical protein BXZ70DRAFT_358173 [Cristinia sonorae]